MDISYIFVCWVGSSPSGWCSTNFVRLSVRVQWSPPLQRGLYKVEWPWLVRTFRISKVAIVTVDTDPSLPLIQSGVTAKKRSIWVKLGDFLSRVTFKFDGWPWKQWGTSSMLLQALCIISKTSVNQNWIYSLETLNSGQNQWLYVQCDFEIGQMTFGHIFFATSSFVHHFVVICELKLELQSTNT